MQFAKDSFSVALRERLSALNPARTIVQGGAERPAVVVLENEAPCSAKRMPNCFYLEWGPAQAVKSTSARQPMYQMAGTISYFSVGTVPSGVDRGRVLGELDRELLMICRPPSTGKRDYSQSPSTDLGTSVVWTLPSMDEPKVAKDEPASVLARLERVAKLDLFFFPEVESL